MKKVLLVGEPGEIAENLDECLADDFQVQLCPGELTDMKAMVKVIKPDLVIICQIGVEEDNNAIFTWLQEKYPGTPILGITTSEGWKQCKNFYKSEQFGVLFRPLVKSELLEKCYRFLGVKSENGPEYKTADNRKKKIMIVDDSILLLRTMKNMLEKQYDICLVKSGEQALKMIPDENPDLILLDYEMEGMNGKDTFEAIKENEDMRFIPVVFLTSIDDRKSIYNVLRSKPDGYILKPPEEKKIRKIIEKLLQVNNI